MGSLPHDWLRRTVSEIAAPHKYACVGGPFGSSLTKKHYIEEGGVPIIRGNNLTTAGHWMSEDSFAYVSQEKGEELTKNAAYPGDIVFTQRGTLGQVARIRPDSSFQKYIVSQSQMKLAVNEAAADPDYVTEYFRSPLGQRQIENSTTATGVPHINLSLLRQFVVPLPPLPEQRKIAAILSSVDEAIEKTQAVIDQVQVVKKGLMQELLTRGIPGRHTRFKQTEIGEIPEEWEVIRIGDCGSWSSGGTPSKRKPQYWNGDVPWVSPKDMKRLRITDAIDHVTEAAIGNGTRLVPESTLLMVVRGMILAHSFPVAITGNPVTFNQDMKALNVDDRFDPEFVLRWLRHRESWFVERVSTSSHGTKRLTSDTLFDAPLPLPTRDEQERIAASASALDEYVDSLRSESMALTALKTGLMSVLLTGEVRVKVDEQDGVAA